MKGRLGRRMTTRELNRNIRAFYDAASELWENTWGEHMHHGYYGADGTENRNHRQAQQDLIEELLKWARITRADHILDVGCGIGGSCLYLAEKYNARAAGITLSPVQASRARQRALAAPQGHFTRFVVADALNPSFAHGTYDLVWSLESGEHMPDKREFLQACADMLSPGGTFVMATWCHRPLPPDLSAGERRFLNRLYRAYHLPGILSIPQYAALASEVGFDDVTTADWSAAVAPFWKAVGRSALRFRSIRGLFGAGWPAIRGALAMRFMTRGYRRGLIRFGLLRGKKP